MSPPEDAIWLPGEETTVVIETGHGGDSVFGGSTSTAGGPEIGAVGGRWRRLGQRVRQRNR